MLYLRTYPPIAIIEMWFSFERGLVRILLQTGHESLTIIRKKKTDVRVASVASVANELNWCVILPDVARHTNDRYLEWNEMEWINNMDTRTSRTVTQIDAVPSNAGGILNCRKTWTTWRFSAVQSSGVGLHEIRSCAWGYARNNCFNPPIL